MAKATIRKCGPNPSKTASHPKTTVTTTSVEQFDGPAPRLEETREPKPSIDGYIRRLTPEELAQHSFYIYRLSDAVTNREGPLYLKRLNQIDLSQIELGVFSDSIKDFTCRRYGGSKYKVKVINHKLGRGLYTLTFEIEGSPILSERETWTGLGQPPRQPAGQPPAASVFDDSMRKLIAGIVREQFDKMRERRSQSPPGLNPIEVVRHVADMMGAAHKASIEMAQKQTPAAVDPVTLLTSTITALKTVGIVGQKQAPARNSLYETLKMLKDLGLIGQHRSPLPRPQEVRSLLTDLNKSIIALGDFQEVTGRSGGGSNKFGGVLREFLHSVPSMMEETPDFPDKAREIDAAGGYPSPPPNTGLVTPSPRPGAPTPPRSIASGAPLHSVTPPVRPSGIDVFEVIAARISMRIVELFRAGISGEGVAGFLEMFDPSLAGQLGALSPDTLMKKVIEKDPVLRAMVGDPRLPEFVEGFHRYFKHDLESHKKPVEAPCAQNSSCGEKESN